MEPNIQGPISTADSSRSGRLVVDAGLKSKKKKALIASVRRQSSSPQN